MDNIHTMARQSEDGVQLESHTLPLVGISTGLFILFSNTISSYIAPDNNETAVHIELALGSVLLAIIFIANHFITRTKRLQRQETTSLLHKKVVQILRVIIGMSFVLSIYMLINFGPGKLALWYLILVFGLCLYVIGLFDSNWYKVNGIFIFLFSIVALISDPPDITLRLITASLFILGGILIQRLKPLAETTLKQSIYSMGLLLLAVLVGYIIRISDESFSAPTSLQHVSLSQYQALREPEDLVVSLLKNTTIQIKSKLIVDVFTAPYINTIETTLSKNMDIQLTTQLVTKTFRMDGSKWITMDDAPFIRRYERINTLEPDKGPYIKRIHTVRINPDMLD